MADWDQLMRGLDKALGNLARAVEEEEPKIAFARDPWEKPKAIPLKEADRGEG